MPRCASGKCEERAVKRIERSRVAKLEKTVAGSEVRRGYWRPGKGEKEEQVEKSSWGALIDEGEVSYVSE